MQEKRYTIEEKMKIALEDAEKETGQKGLKGDELVSDLFAKGENTKENEEKDELSSQDTDKLEFLINLEMKLSHGTFRLEPEIFFKEDLTLNHFVQSIHEAEDSDQEQDFEKIEEFTQDEAEEAMDESDSTEDEDSYDSTEESSDEEE